MGGHRYFYCRVTHGRELKLAPRFPGKLARYLLAYHYHKHIWKIKFSLVKIITSICAIHRLSQVLHEYIELVLNEIPFRRCQM